MEIEIFCHDIPAETVQARLRTHVEGTGQEREVLIKLQSSRFRALDAAILVAVVAGSSAAVSAILTGLLQVAKQRRSGKIMLQAKDGTRIEIPADTPSDQIDELVEKVRNMSRATIHL